MKMTRLNLLQKNIIFNSLFLLILLLLTGILLSTVIGLLLSRFSFKLLKISSINSLFLSLGIFLNYFFIGKLNKKVKNSLLMLLSFSFVTGISFVGMIYLFLIEHFDLGS